MPIFEYRCESCQNKFEKIVFHERNSVQCPNCSASEVSKQLSSFAVGAGKSTQKAQVEAGPCHCGAPQRGMCSMN